MAELCMRSKLNGIFTFYILQTFCSKKVQIFYSKIYLLVDKLCCKKYLTYLIQNIFSSTRVSYRYHLAHRSYTGELEMRNTVYVSLPESHMVIMIKSPFSTKVFTF